MAATMGGALLQRSAVKSAPRVAANRSLLRPQPLVQRSRTLAAGSTTATTKTPTSVKITIQGRRLPVRMSCMLPNTLCCLSVFVCIMTCAGSLHMVDLQCGLPQEAQHCSS